MHRRNFLQQAGAIASVGFWPSRSAWPNEPVAFTRVRPRDAAWPSPKQWDQLRGAVNGRLIKLEPPFSGCATHSTPSCMELLRHLDNQFFIGDQPALTQISGWANAWSSQPSAYAVAAENTADIVAAVNFARTHRLRLVVKGGGHSYKGTSNSVDSLLV